MTIEDLLNCILFLWCSGMILNTIMFCVLCDRIKDLKKR
jgi:hypothetical protein